MCGRYTLAVSLDALTTFLAAEGGQNLPARDGVAPTRGAPVIRLGEDDVRRIALLRWDQAPAGRLVHRPVSRLVNSARAEGPELIRHVEPEQPRFL